MTIAEIERMVLMTNQRIGPSFTEWGGPDADAMHYIEFNGDAMPYFTAIKDPEQRS